MISYTYFLVIIKQGAQLKRHIDATLGSGNLREAVRLPPGEDLNEWLAVNSIALTLWCISMQMYFGGDRQNRILSYVYACFVLYVIFSCH